MSEGLACHPAALKPGVLRIEELMLIKRSPIPSLMLARYDVRMYHVANLSRND
jgi:hypothetical protein